MSGIDNGDGANEFLPKEDKLYICS